MKKIIFLSILLIMSAIFSCSREDVSGCKSSTTTALRTLNLADYNPASENYNSVVLNFSFLQILTDNLNNECSANRKCSLNVVIKNATDKNIAFDYSLDFTNGFSPPYEVKWNYQMWPLLLLTTLSLLRI